MLALSELGGLKDRLAVPDDVAKRAARIYLRALERDRIRGRAIPVLVASVIYAACRGSETPRSLKDVERAANIKRKHIARGYRFLVNELGLKMPVADSALCVERIAGRIGIAEGTRRSADDVLERARRSAAAAGKDPMGLAAAAIYFACVEAGEGRSQRDIAEAADMTESTVRNRYRGLRQSLGDPQAPRRPHGAGRPPARRASP